MPSPDPFTRPEIARALEEVEREVAAFFGSLSDAEWGHRVGEAWTPAEQLRHLVTSVNAVARGLTVPKWLLRMRFGRARAASRGYAEVRDAYRRALAGGGKATGAFVPAREEVAPAQAAGNRAEALARWARAGGRLRAALEGWSEERLDRVRLPHPLLGLLTVREMLFFTLYHDRHHIEATRSRLPGREAPAAEGEVS